MVRNLKFFGFAICACALAGFVIFMEINNYFPRAADSYASPVNEDANAIVTLNGDSIAIDDQAAASIDGSVITITKGGTYVISGSLNDGQIIVDVDKETKVTLALNGVDITCSNSAPIYVMSADRVKIDLVINTENILTDGEFYYFNSPTQSKPNACIYSKDDLTVSGAGSLTINANYNNGIGTKNDLRVSDGVVTINAYKNGLKGNGSVTVERGSITIKTQYGDGIKTDDNSETGKGYVLIEGGEVFIDAGEDSIQADNLVVIRSARVTSKAVKFDVNCDNRQIDEGCLTVQSNTFAE